MPEFFCGCGQVSWDGEAVDGIGDTVQGTLKGGLEAIACDLLDATVGEALAALGATLSFTGPTLAASYFGPLSAGSSDSFFQIGPTSTLSIVAGVKGPLAVGRRGRLGVDHDLVYGLQGPAGGPDPV